jgi:hypothetical protein
VGASLGAGVLDRPAAADTAPVDDARSQGWDALAGTGELDSYSKRWSGARDSNPGPHGPEPYRRCLRECLAIPAPPSLNTNAGLSGPLGPRLPPAVPGNLFSECSQPAAGAANTVDAQHAVALPSFPDGSGSQAQSRTVAVSPLQCRWLERDSPIGAVQVLVRAGPGATRSPVQALRSQVEAVRPNDCSGTPIYTDTTKVVRVAKRLEHAPSTRRVHLDFTDVAVAERQAEAIGPQRLDGPDSYHRSMLRPGGDADQPVVTPRARSQLAWSSA